MGLDDIYSSVPEHVVKGEADFLKRQEILQLLKNSGKVLNAKQIARSTGLAVSDTQVKVRKHITELIEIDGEPIVSVHKGFMYATEENMIYTYTCSLRSRMQGIQRRITALRKIAVTHRFKK